MAGGAILQGRTAPGLTSAVRVGHLYAVASLALTVGACVEPRRPPVPADPFAAPDPPAATLIDRRTIDVTWKHNASAPGGYWVEFATPGSDFVKLEVAWAFRPSFRHSDLAPATRFIYRVVPFFGRPSNVAIVSTPAYRPGEALSLPEGPLADGEGVDTSLGATTAKHSLREASTFVAAAPAVLSASLGSSSSAELRWEDRATDEDGYLVEVSEHGRAFTVCALLAPNTTSFRKSGLPSDSQVYFRVRAFFQGPPSKLAELTTPAEETTAKPAVQGRRKIQRPR
jgi:hypothetical protein